MSDTKNTLSPKAAFDIGYKGTAAEFKAALEKKESTYDLVSGAAKALREKRAENFQALMTKYQGPGKTWMPEQHTVLNIVGHLSAEDFTLVTAKMDDAMRQVLLEESLLRYAKGHMPSWPLRAEMINLIDTALFPKTTLNFLLARACGNNNEKAVDALYAKGADFDEALIQAKSDHSAIAVRNITLHKERLGAKSELEKLRAQVAAQKPPAPPSQ